MEDISLYRKHRPHNFENLVGQEHVRTTLINALKTKHVAHAYLFTGPRGTGKTSSARLIAKSLNCEKLRDGYEPCDSCDFCEDINSGRLIDLIEIDAASNRGIDEVRDLKEKINFAPTRAKYKVYIIDEVHMMTKEAFNALLKTLEEPPAHAYFILATTEIHKIPDTIISRCQRFDFRRISMTDVVERLRVVAEREGFEVEDKALEAIARYVDGGMRDAIGLLEQLVVDSKLEFEEVRKILGLSDHTLLEKLYETVMEKEAERGLKIVHELHDHGSDLKQFNHEFVDHLRINLLASVSNGDQSKTGRLIELIEIFEEAQKKSGLSIPQLPLEIAIIKACGALKQVYEASAPREAVVEAPKPPKPPVQEKVQEEKEAPVTKLEESVVASGSMNIEEISQRWPRVTERIKTPSLRMSLKDCKPIDLQGAALTVAFNTNFHMEKVMDHDHRVELESSIQEVFGRGFKISAEVREVEIKPMVENNTNNNLDELDSPEPKKEKEEPVVKKDQVAEAMDIFGGELVE